ncbi:MAG: T9SS type A sorting domain-containing protein [Saprospiraceae bacterium]|nr:T9SS type A sorting domain-containing protein [Saprospiraceae bacterium]
MRVFTNLLFTLFLIGAMSVHMSSQNADIGASSTISTSSTGSDPIDGYYESFRYQVIYTATELSAAGMPSGATITGLGWSVSGDYAGGNLLGYSIKLAHTSATNCASHNSAALTEVKAPFSYNPTVVAVGSFDVIPFSANFIWDGTSNILVDICSAGANAFTSPYGQVRIASSTTSASRFVRSDGTGSQCGITTNTTNGDKPSVRFTYTAAACSGTPAPGNTLSSTNPVCSGNAFTLSLQNSTLGTGVTYQWQSSPDGSIWTDISGANNSTYTTTQTSATYYRCNVTCSGNTGASTALQVTMNNFMNCYCVTTPTSVNGVDIITGVSVGTYSNSSNGNDADNYISVNNTPPNLQLSGTYSGSITYGTDGNQFGAAWIDWNQNGTFEASENIYLATSSSGASSTVTFSFTVPAGATLGNTKIRFRGGSDSAYTGACTTSSFGETEDYLVNIVAATCTSPTVSAATVVPNCGSNQWSYTFNITSLGSASSLSLTGGNTSVSTVTSVPTTVTVGPFASGVSGNNVLISGGDINCDYTVTSPAAYNCPPINDDCANAINLACNGFEIGNNSAASDEILPSSTCGSTTSALFKGMWYKITPASSGNLTIATCSGTTFDTYLRVYSGSCSSLTCVDNTSGVGYNDDGCAPYSTLTFPAIANTTYYVLVTGYYSYSVGSFTLTSTCPCTPPAAAITPTPSDVLSCSTPSITLTATPSGQASYTWGGGSASGTSESISVTSAGTYTVTISNGSCSSTASVTVTGSVCAAPSSPGFSNVTSSSADLAWTAASPAPGGDGTGEYQYYYSTSSTPPTVSTSGTPNWGTSVSISGLTCGTVYFAWVRSICASNCYSAWTGPASVTIPSCVINNECSGAININGGGVAGVPTGTPIASTTFGATSSGAASNCGGDPDDDVWFEFTTDPDISDGQDYSIVVSGASFTPVITLYSGGCLATEVSCIVGTSLTGVGLAANTQYYVRVYDLATGFTHGEGSSRAAGSFSIAASGTALPITLSTLKAVAVNNINVISWSTSSELNTKRFIVERSENGNTNWSNVGEVTASGTTAETRNYTFNDEKPLSLSYYRLVSVDIDGSSKISNVVSVQRNKDAFGIINIFPVPSHETITVTYESTDRSYIDVNIYNVLGQHVLYINRLSDIGNNSFNIPIQQLTNGIYTITIGNGANTATSKFIKE